MSQTIIAQALIKGFMLFFVLAVNPAMADQQALTKKLEALVNEHNMRGMAVYVIDQKNTNSYGHAIGMADDASQTAMSTDTPVRIASNTKTYVAATVLRLHEEGMLDIDHTMDRYISSTYNDLLKADGYQTNEITLRHLLSHSAGFFDHAATPNYMKALADTPNHQWTRQEQLQKLVEWGDPLWPTNQKFQYSDSGYLLLGHIIEQASNLPLAIAVRQYLNFDDNGLNNTWWEISETTPQDAKPRAHQFLGPRDGYNIHASFDSYGGGGLLSTVEDMAHFYQALFNGKVFKNPETLALMTSAEQLAEPDKYRLGLFPGKVDDISYFQHSGFWGTSAFYAPDLKMSVAAVVLNQADYRRMMRFIPELFKAAADNE